MGAKPVALFSLRAMAIMSMAFLLFKEEKR
jgi:hypothetical protein